MSKDKKKKPGLAVVKTEPEADVPMKSEGNSVVRAHVWREAGTGMYGLEIQVNGVPEGATADEFPTAWMDEESTQALADALQVAGITPSEPAEILAVLRKELEDAKDFSRDLMDVLKAGRES